MKLLLAVGAVVFALSIALVISAVSSGLERTGTKDEAGHLVRVTTDGAERGLSALWP